MLGCLSGCLVHSRARGNQLRFPNPQQSLVSEMVQRLLSHLCSSGEGGGYALLVVKPSVEVTPIGESVAEIRCQWQRYAFWACSSLGVCIKKESPKHKQHESI